MVSLSIVQIQSVALGHVHSSLGILSQPIPNIQLVIDSVIKNPQIVLDDLDFLAESGGNNSPDNVRLLERLVSDLTASHASAEPDVTYIVQKQSGCIIKPSGHFNISGIQPAALDIPKSAQSFLIWLVKKKSTW